MALSIPTRKRRLGNGSLADAWKSVKSKHKGLGSGAYRPDIGPIAAKYDQELGLYDKIAARKDNLATLVPSGNQPEKIQGHYAELKKLADQWEAHVKSTSSTTGQGEDWLEETLTDQFEFSENEIKTRRALWTQIASLEDQYLADLKRHFDQFKAQNKAVADGIRKLEDECEKTANQIHQLIAAYQKIAIQQNDDTVVDDLRMLLEKV